MATMRRAYGPADEARLEIRAFCRRALDDRLSSADTIARLVFAGDALELARARPEIAVELRDYFGAVVTGHRPTIARATIVLLATFDALQRVNLWRKA